MKQLLIALVLGISFVATVGSLISCEKASAEPPRPLSVCCCSDSSGTYIPAVSNISNISSIVQIGTAHFIRWGNECEVSGRVAVNVTNAFNTHTFFTVSLPFPSTLPIPDGAIGVCTVTQSINTLTAGFVNTNPSGTLVIFWDQSFGTTANVYYKFSYTIN